MATDGIGGVNNTNTSVNKGSVKKVDHQAVYEAIGEMLSGSKKSEKADNHANTDDKNNDKQDKKSGEKMVTVDHGYVYRVVWDTIKGWFGADKK